MRLGSESFCYSLPLIKAAEAEHEQNRKRNRKQGRAEEGNQIKSN